MASSSSVRSCNTCNKAAVTMCFGCEKGFCLPHLTQHRQKLAQDMDKVGQDHDILKEQLASGNGGHPLLSRIDEWEKTSIKMIRSVAEQARTDTHQWMQQTNTYLRQSIDIVTKELQVSRDADDYTEINLTRWMNQLQELKTKLEKPSTIEIQDDDERVSVRMIKVIRRGKNLRKISYAGFDFK